MSNRLAAIPGVVLIAVAAAMWGTDPLLRKSILTVPASTIVFGEHVILVLFPLPLLVPALRAVWAAGPRPGARPRHERYRVDGRAKDLQ